MTTLSPQAQSVIEQFGQQPGVTADQLLNLRRVINSSPPLAAQFDSAVLAGDIRHLSLLPPGVNAGGTYDGSTKTINIRPSILSNPNDQPFDAAELAFVVGHEIQHSSNHAAKQAAYAQFNEDARAIAASTHDYTTAIGNLISANRKDEATAQLAGWNAVAGMIKAQNPNATLEEMYDSSARARAYIRSVPGPPASHEMLSSLTVNQDLSLSSTPENIEAMGHYYFDKPGSVTRIGHNGNSDYPNYYGAYAVSVASQLESANTPPGTATRMTINMARLGLSEQLMEENGINLGRGSPAPQPYWDSSTSPPLLRHFDHTHTTHTHIPISAQEYEKQSAAQPMPAGPSLESVHGAGKSQLTSADQQLHDQIREKVALLDAASGRTFDSTSERMTASLLVLAKGNGMERVDHVVLSRETKEHPACHNVFVVKGDLADPAAARACMPTAEAASRPTEQSFVELERVNQRDQALGANVQSQEQQPEHVRGVGR